MYKEIISTTRAEYEKAIEFFRKELGKLRTGQASPALVEDVLVDLFSSKMTIQQLAAISCPERRQILIQPWDTSYIEPIQKALLQSQIGVSPIVDKDAIRITLPPLTQEFREKLKSILAEKAEQTRQMMRKKRDEAWGQIQEKARTGAIREDDKFKGKDELQKLIDEYQRKIDELCKRKQEEIEHE